MGSGLGGTSGSARDISHNGHVLDSVKSLFALVSVRRDARDGMGWNGGDGPVDAEYVTAVCDYCLSCQCLSTSKRIATQVLIHRLPLLPRSCAAV